MTIIFEIEKKYKSDTYYTLSLSTNRKVTLEFAPHIFVEGA